MATKTTPTEATATPETKSRSRTVRSLRGGQMTIPIEFRRALGIDEETLLRVTLEDGALRVAPVREEENATGSNPLRDLYEYFAPVREAVLASGISQEELWAEIDAAIAEVRAEKRETMKQSA
jgi:bifunctional DNA-binding transcriptional regulator/antitoxin component of YhaV-PrlF toxin-antitoxin module